MADFFVHKTTNLLYLITGIRYYGKGLAGFYGAQENYSLG